MKNITYYLLVLVGMVTTLSACSDDDITQQHMPQIFFDQHYYTLGKTSVDLVLNADEAPSSDVTIPIYFGGEAEEGIDFEMPEQAFTFKAGETEASLTINRLLDNIGDDKKSLYVNLKDAPEGYSLGLSNFADVTLLGSNGVIMSFSETEGTVKSEEEFQINLTDMKGNNYRPSVATQIELEVDKSSTAIEGEHFEFIGGSYATVRRNRYYGTFGIKFLKKEEGKDKLVLRFADKDGYASGLNSTMTLTIQGPDNYSGTWEFVEVANKEDQINMWSEYYLPEDKFPTGSSADRITLSGDTHLKYTFTPELSGDLKNYFGNTSRTITYVEDRTLNVDDQIKATVLEVPDVNLNFSADYTDTSRSANVGFRYTTDDNGEEVLECIIFDFIPKGDGYGSIVWTEYESYGMDPLAEGMMESIAPRIHFKRVK